DIEVAPARYLVPAELDDVVERLRTHGIIVEPLAADRTMEVQEFVLDSIRTAERPFQGHEERTLFGSWRTVERTVPAGTLALEVDQALGRLAFYLLEPRSDDGFANWGLLDEALEGARVYPVLRVLPAGG
ncbi:MAG TPA: hypothetical protein VLL48_11680, partial [Longimicrobiales bacterium]|nr:hypothetical protein [Longimicrobiales bacterium]